MPTVGKGASGPLVREIQRRLNMLDYVCDTDGRFGNETIRQVKLFQRDQGLPITHSSAGKVDAMTLAALVAHSG